MNIPTDKSLHFIVGVLIYAVGHFAGHTIGFALVVVAGIGKEIYDYAHRDKHNPEFMDALVTILGGVAGYICAL